MILSKLLQNTGLVNTVFLIKMVFQKGIYKSLNCGRG